MKKYGGQEKSKKKSRNHRTLLDSLMEWSIIPKDFPMPQDPKQKIERFRSVKEQTPVKLLDIRDRQGSIISHLKL